MDLDAAQLGFGDVGADGASDDGRPGGEHGAALLRHDGEVAEHGAGRDRAGDRADDGADARDLTPGLDQVAEDVGR